MSFFSLIGKKVTTLYLYVWIIEGDFMKILQRTKTNQQRISHSGQKQHMDAFIIENV